MNKLTIVDETFLDGRMNLDFAHSLSRELVILEEGKQQKYLSFQKTRKLLQDINFFIKTLYEVQKTKKQKTLTDKLFESMLVNGQITKDDICHKRISAPSTTRFATNQIKRSRQALLGHIGFCQRVKDNHIGLGLVDSAAGIAQVRVF